MSKWISVKEKMPEASKDVEFISKQVLFTDGKRIGIGCYDFKDKSWYGYNFGPYPGNKENITYWMPLPELP